MKVVGCCSPKSGCICNSHAFLLCAQCQAGGEHRAWCRSPFTCAWQRLQQTELGCAPTTLCVLRCHPGDGSSSSHNMQVRTFQYGCCPWHKECWETWSSTVQHASATEPSPRTMRRIDFGEWLLFFFFLNHVTLPYHIFFKMTSPFLITHSWIQPTQNQSHHFYQKAWSAVFPVHSQLSVGTCRNRKMLDQHLRPAYYSSLCSKMTLWPGGHCFISVLQFPPLMIRDHNIYQAKSFLARYTIR